MGAGFLHWRDGNVLELDGSSGYYTTLAMY